MVWIFCNLQPNQILTNSYIQNLLFLICKIVIGKKLFFFEFMFVVLFKKNIYLFSRNKSNFF